MAAQLDETGRDLDTANATVWGLVREESGDLCLVFPSFVGESRGGRGPMGRVEEGGDLCGWRREGTYGRVEEGGDLCGRVGPEGG